MRGVRLAQVQAYETVRASVRTAARRPTRRFALGDQPWPKLRSRDACVGNSFSFSDHSTVQPTRQLTHAAAAIQGSANNNPSPTPVRSADTDAKCPSWRLQPQGSLGHRGREKIHSPRLTARPGSPAFVVLLGPKSLLIVGSFAATKWPGRVEVRLKRLDRDRQRCRFRLSPLSIRQPSAGDGHVVATVNLSVFRGHPAGG